MMGAARGAITLLLLLLTIPPILRLILRFFQGVLPGELTTGGSVVLNILLLLFLIGLAVRLGRRLRGQGLQGAHRDAAERRARVAPRYRAEAVPAMERPHPGLIDSDPELDLHWEGSRRSGSSTGSSHA